MSFALWLRFKMFCSDDSQFGELMKSFVTALSNLQILFWHPDIFMLGFELCQKDQSYFQLRVQCWQGQNHTKRLFQNNNIQTFCASTPVNNNTLILIDLEF
jgi:hypothetical protein